MPSVLSVDPARSARMRWAAACMPPATRLPWLLLSRIAGSSSVLSTSNSLPQGPVAMLSGSVVRGRNLTHLLMPI